MDWTDIIIEVPLTHAGTAEAIAVMVAGGGIYVEDYSDLETQAWEIAHVDLIEAELLAQPRDREKIHLYIPPDELPAAALETLRSRLEDAAVPYVLLTQDVRQQDWENAWKQHYHPFEVGRRLAVAPCWADYTSERTIIRLDPGMAFGTGTHETTFLCLEALDELVQGGERVLDVGTGSGILGIAAVLLEAESALGIDIDPLSVRTARENAERNSANHRFAIEEGDLVQKAAGKYGIITANIVADAILRLAPSIPSLLAPGGVFLASGVIEERREEVGAALRAAGLSRVETRHKNGWVLFLAQA